VLFDDKRGSCHVATIMVVVQLLKGSTCQLIPDGYGGDLSSDYSDQHVSVDDTKLEWSPFKIVS
jgi:hypothetical protein